MNFILRSFVISILLILAVTLLVSTLADAKHIIIAYDVSISMYRLRSQTFMTPSDFVRVNRYLADMLFEEFPQQKYSGNDEIIKRYEGPYVGKPLYQSGDLLSYIEFETARNYKLRKRQGISRQVFMRLLPNPNNLRSSFSGEDTFLGATKVEIYTQL